MKRGCVRRCEAGSSIQEAFDVGVTDILNILELSELFELSKRVTWVIRYWKATFGGLDLVKVSLLALPLPFEVQDSMT